MTSLVIGASSVRQLDENLDALADLELSTEELARIDEYAVESGVDRWRASSQG
jgi:L-glyceraldehyde 3-phosphate reductase